jgi:hypothetical protein
MSAGIWPNSRPKNSMIVGAVKRKSVRVTFFDEIILRFYRKRTQVIDFSYSIFIPYYAQQAGYIIDERPSIVTLVPKKNRLSPENIVLESFGG